MGVGGPGGESRTGETFREVEHAWIPLADGCRLAARLWIPLVAATRRVPAILEYLPYRKRDGTRERDDLTHPWFAARGYAGVRVDIRGSGESDGLLLDEYLLQEQDDAVEVIAWIAAQPWCNGQVGMMGISWGGFNALQVAARRPPALRAVVSVCATDDRYADDIHYRGGALLMENLGWAATMFAYQSRPPDPVLAGDGWRGAWLRRLEAMPLFAARWLAHQRRDDYWRHGSVCEDYGAIEVPVLAVGAWCDGYHDPVPRLLEGLRAPVEGIVGPWTHRYPHLEAPETAVGFLQECRQWWDRWLRDPPREAASHAAYRVFVMDSVAPDPARARRPGRWLALDGWPSPEVQACRLRLGAGGLAAEGGPEVALQVRSPVDTGLCGGEWGGFWTGPEHPVDQREDDARSLCFDGAPLETDTIVVGAPEVDLVLRADRPVATVAVRLCDLRPDGTSARVSYGVLNLCHLAGHDAPAALVPGETRRARVRLDHCAYRVPAGHRLRVAISTGYWPMLWPAPEPVTLTVMAGASGLTLPVYRGPDRPAPVFEPAVTAPAPDRSMLRAPAARRVVERDVGSATTTVRVHDDGGEWRIGAHGLRSERVYRETHAIRDGDPLSARSDIHWTMRLARGAWAVRTETHSAMWSDAAHFHLDARLEAYEGSERVLERRWQRRVPRDHL